MPKRKLSNNRVELLHYPYSKYAVDAWRRWLTHHTIDPRTVIIPGFIERDPKARQVRYLSYVPAPDKRNGFMLSEDGLEVLKQVVVVQLESVPSEFPPLLPR